MLGGLEQDTGWCLGEQPFKDGPSQSRGATASLVDDAGSINVSVHQKLLKLFGSSHRSLESIQHALKLCRGNMCAA